MDINLSFVEQHGVSDFQVEGNELKMKKKKKKNYSSYPKTDSVQFLSFHIFTLSSFS